MFQSMNGWLLSFLFLTFCWTITKVDAWNSQPAGASPIPPAIGSLLQQAIQSTNLSAQNITAAHAACDQWERLLGAHAGALPHDIHVLCLTLQASCLVRIGRDDLSIPIYNQASDLLATVPVDNAQIREDVVIGKAHALQRLLQYELARDAFLQSNSERAACGAALCSLRLGQLEMACRILKQHCSRKNAESIVEIDESECMLETLLFLQGNNGQKLTRLQAAATSLFSALYGGWIYSVLEGPPEQPRNSRVPYLELASINQCAFDDPDLVNLDDKILLHRLLSRYCKTSATFWPQSMVLPEDLKYARGVVSNEDHDEEKTTWILKRRSGYGSHGNQVVTLDEAIQETPPDGDSRLLQLLVNPPLLLRMRKFSLRIYVIFFADALSDTYIATRGLVKLASEPFQADKSNASIHMTNSGREATMVQHDLKFLETELAKMGYSFDVFWKDVREVVKSVLEAFHTMKQQLKDNSPDRQHTSERVGLLGIPKILGFDFVVDSSFKPWLVEVNRFPGLEPRDESDRTVKLQVVNDVWIYASRRMNIDPMMVLGLQEETGAASCLKHLSGQDE